MMIKKNYSIKAFSTNPPSALAAASATDLKDQCMSWKDANGQTILDLTNYVFAPGTTTNLTCSVSTLPTSIGNIFKLNPSPLTANLSVKAPLPCTFAMAEIYQGLIHNDRRQ